MAGAGEFTHLDNASGGVIRVPYVAAGGSPRAEIGVAMADRIHGIQYGVESATPSSGIVNVTFTEEFEEPPVVLLSQFRSGTTLNLTEQLYGTPDVDGFSARCFYNGTSNASAYAIDLHWVAIGKLAAKPTTETVDDDMVAGGTITTAWGAEVADFYNLVQIGYTGESVPSGGGDQIITYPRPYSVAPTTIVISDYRGATGYMCNGTLVGIGTGTFTVSQFATNNGTWSTVNTTLGVGVHWMALGGTLA